MNGLYARSFRLACTLGLMVGTVLLMSGCGDGYPASATGVVTLDGASVPHGSVTFIPTTRGAGALAKIESDGSFEARTGRRAGLEPGEYVVTIRSREPSIPDPHGGPPLPGKLITPQRYASSKTSGLKVTIDPGSNTIELELHSDDG